MSGKKGADWFEESERDKMNMLESCKRGHLNEVAKYLNGGIDPDEEDDDGVTALQIAAAKGHRRLVEFLIKEGASLERANYAGMTPFLHACREGHQDIVTLLANYGANAHSLSGLGVSAMALACAGRHLAVVRTLKSLNVAVDPKPSVRLHQIAPTPYMVAFFEMDIQICGFLKQQNAHIWHQIKRLDGLDVIRMGQLLRLPEILMRLNYTENTLQEPPKKIDIRIIIQNGNEQELTKLIKDGEVPNCLQYGLTPLMYAAVSGQLLCAEILLKVGKGGIVDAQENVLGMTALMFAIVAGESQMVQLLLRYLANPRILSTTKKPFSALDLAMYSEINRECMEQLCIQWLKKGGSKMTGIITRPREGSGSSQSALKNQQETPSTTSYRGAITPARLRKALESIGKNLMGLGNAEETNLNNNQIKEDFGGINNNNNNNNQQTTSILKLASENVNQLIEGPARFVLAEHILRGDARPPDPKKSSADDLVLMARQMAISWMTKGNSLVPIPSKNIARNILVEEGEEKDSDGLYSAAQRNAEKELFKTKHRYEPSRKHSSKSTTSRVMRNATQKSPQIDPQRIMRKAPHRLSQQKSSPQGCASDSGSGASLNSNNNQTQWGNSSNSYSMFVTHSNPPSSTPQTSTQNIFYIPQHLTKELVKSKLNEWNLEEQFNQCFGAEEVDELTFATLREEEVWQVLVTQGCQNRQLFKQFLAIIQDIKKCTASSELL